MLNDNEYYSFASVGFANAAPLSAYITTVSPGSTVMSDSPARLVATLLEGNVDAALIPVVDLFANPALSIVDRVGISADGNVTSVLLKCCRPLAEIRTVAKDRSSRTSNMLAELLLRERFNISATVESFDNDRIPDARVVIGDDALRSEPAPGGDYDLAGEWKKMTGLPFVFAVWASRRDHPDAAGLAGILRAALDMGRENIDKLAEKQAHRLGLPLEQCNEYLSNVIKYDMGDRELSGMERFRTMLQQGARSPAAGKSLTTGNARNIKKEEKRP